MANLSIPNAHARNIESAPTSENLITTHLDIWTTAIEQKSSAGRGSSNKFSLYGIKKLRELILELAVRGKLVPQASREARNSPNYEPASVLLERIAAEKAQLVKEGKLKKQKPLLEIGEDEKPFELPNGWEWAFFGDICEIERGGSPRPIKSFITEESNGLNWIKIGDTEIGGKYITKSAEKIRPEGLTKTRQVFPGDFLLTNSMSFGRPYITKIEGCIHDGWLRISPPKPLDKNYLFSLLSSPFIIRSFKKSAAGAVVMNLNADKVKETIIAVPPTEEQHRIVAKVDELMSLCDALEAQTEASIAAHQTLVETLLNALLLPLPQTAANTASQSDASLEPQPFTNSFDKDWQRVAEHFDTLFTTSASIDTLKQTILQLAVMGKLVKQDPNDEPAAKLLARIAKEKAQLIKEGKIKKQKPLPAITDEEKPFELPNGWEWCRFGAVFIDLKYGTSQKSDYGIDGQAVLRIPNVVKGFVCIEDLKYSKLTNKEKEDLRLLSGDLLFIRSNGSLGIVGNCTVVDRDLEDFAYAGYLVRTRLPLEFVSPKFIALVMKTTDIRDQIEKPIRTTSGVKNINSTELGQLIFTMPSLTEQHRIVAKVDELMALCDQLKARLSDAQTTQLHLTDAIVEQAVLQ
ncbi:restriction endonuclease subunit S [Shewanella sp. SM55]|uniref:restriction endonuclease subunit S n=1 Tax=Shewanella sp. SM55 TaxID=2912800 RepID=UPI0021D820FB|nr:restriction endonuclease subunit S [Shewanella sp. SM55]MCU8063387.1 restriction endonuclease subunit S [Shewanella sp. SM55]